MTNRRGVLTRVLPDRTVAEVLVVTEGLTLWRLELLTEVAAAALLAGEGVATHQLAELEEVGHAAGTFQRLVEICTGSGNRNRGPELFTQRRDLLDRAFQAGTVSRHTALVPDDLTHPTVEDVCRDLSSDSEEALVLLDDLSLRIAEGSTLGVEKPARWRQVARCVGKTK